MEPLFGTIIVGFLGAGKTTLLRHLLSGNHGLRIAVLINELGAKAIDLQLITGMVGEFVRLPNGCCCFLLDNKLPQIIETLLQQPVPPDYVMVECSGTLLPEEITHLFKQHAGSLIQIESIVAVVDAEQIRSLEGSNAQFAQKQILGVDFVILNKIDLIPSFTLAAVKRWLEQIAPGVRTFETSFGQIPLDLLVGIGEYVQLIRRQRNRAYLDVAGWNYPFHLPLHSNGEVKEAIQTAKLFQTWTYTSEEPFDYVSLCQGLESIPRSIFRVKGRVLVTEASRTVQIQMVGRHASLRLNEKLQSTCSTQIVAVGPAKRMDCDRLFQLFDSCHISIAQPTRIDEPIYNFDWTRF